MLTITVARTLIARARILLPYSFSLPADHGLTTYEVEIEGYRARVYPPHRSQVDRSALEPDSPKAITDLARQLHPADPQPHTAVIVVDGSETVQADVLQIDFFRDEFDRRHGTYDPPPEVAFRMANDLLARLRTLGRSGHVKPLSETSTIWRIEYLNDDESDLEPAEGLHRATFAVTWQWRVFGLRKDLWEAARALPDDFAPTPWDTLLLDAVDLLPDIGPSIVLAFAAIETRIESALDVLAPQAGISEEFWDWIKRREDDYRREPSIREQVDQLLHGLSGRSLKEDDRLWQAFQNLRSARNTFVHEGRATIGTDPVTGERVSQLIALAGEIIDWIENLLPAEERRPRYARETEGGVELTKVMVAPAAVEEAPQEE